MGEEREGESSQKLKKIAAAAYDYENDPRWADYWSNILIPPHMSSTPDVIAHFKQKFYKRYIDSDLVVEPMSSGSSSQPTKRPAASARSTNEGSTTRTSATPAASATSATPVASRTSASPTGSTSATSPPTSLRWDRQTIQFSVNAWVFLVAVLAIIPLVPKHLSRRAYWLSFIGTACSCVYSLYSQYGRPREWNLQGLQVYFGSITMSKDFIYFIYCLPLISSNLFLKFALIPILCRALVRVAKFLRRNFSQSTLYRKYLEEPCVWVESNTTTLGILSSHAEIGLGFLLIISLFSWQRNPVHTFFYWQVLKLMYHAPATSDYHLSVWTKIGRTVQPFIHRYVPFLETPLSAIQRWWLRRQ